MSQTFLEIVVVALASVSLVYLFVGLVGKMLMTIDKELDEEGKDK